MPLLSSVLSIFIMALLLRPLISAMQKRRDVSAGTQVGLSAVFETNDPVESLEAAAKRGEVSAQYRLACRYHARANFAEASAWYRRAVAQEDARSASNLAALYAKGEGVAQNLQEAARLFRFAAERNDRIGQFNLALCFRDGMGVPQDPVAARRWFMKAAELGDTEAKVILGAFYEHGHGVAQDFVEAATWYGLAASEGQPRGQGAFGFMYAEGKGVPHDLVKALSWFSLAARGGDADSIVNIGIATRKMTAEQIAAAQQLAARIDLQLQAGRCADRP